MAVQIKTDVKYAVLSGPSHAEEIARKLPTTVAAASKPTDELSLISDTGRLQYGEIKSRYER